MKKLSLRLTFNGIFVYMQKNSVFSKWNNRKTIWRPKKEIYYYYFMVVWCVNPKMIEWKPSSAGNHHSQLIVNEYVLTAQE